MKLAHVVRLISSVSMLSFLAACGGGGGGNDAAPVEDYPAANTVVVKTATSAIPASSYATTAQFASSTVNGQSVSTIHSDLTVPVGSAEFSIDYVDSDPTKYVLWLSDSASSSEYACRSAAMNLADYSGFVVCDQTVSLVSPTASPGYLRVKTVTLAKDGTSSSVKVKLAANMNW